MSLSTRDRRMLAAALVAAIAALPAIALRALCVGRGCEARIPVRAEVPFCSLAEDVRGALAAGYRAGRSPEALAVTGDAVVRGADGLRDLDPAWPGIDAAGAAVPLLFSGAGVGSGTLPEGVRLDAVAPTVAEIIDLDRPHPEVRSGEALPGVAAGPAPRLALQVVWKGVGSEDLRRRPDAWPVLRRLLQDGAGTLDARTGSLPLDPTAVLATIGTGGLPRQHGIIGTLVRNEEGEVAEVGRPRAPLSVIATLGDDLVELRRSRVGVVGTHPADRAAVGGGWYVGADEPDVIVARGPVEAQVEAANRLLASGYGEDAEPDLLVVAMHGAVPRLDGALGSLIVAAEAAAPGATAVVVTSTGSSGAEGAPALTHDQVRRRVEADDDVPEGAVAATALGGLFLDQDVLAGTGASAQVVVRALARVRAPEEEAFADTFSGVAVEFARYC